LLKDPSGQTPVLDATEKEQDREVAKALWAFEAWRRYEDVDSDDDYGPPSSFGYEVLLALSHMVLSAPLKEGRDLWEPVFLLGADAHYSISHFISGWFVQISDNCDNKTFVQHWRAMLEYALEAPNWSSGRRWYYGERLLLQLMGCGSTDSISRLPGFQSVILQMRDLYEVWARVHLHRDEENVSGFCGFLSSDVGAPLRLDGIQWLSAAIHGDSNAAHWRREHTGNALIELLDVILSEDVEKVLENSDVRDALIGLAAGLVTRQVTASLALQERIQALR